MNPDAISKAGACGLMQITKSTAKKMNFSDIFNPQKNIDTGVRYLKSLYDFYDKAKGEDRLNIALAAYNRMITEFPKSFSFIVFFTK